MLRRSVRVIDTILAKEPGRDINVLPELIKMTGFSVEPIELGGNTSKETFLSSLLENDNRFLHLSSHGDSNGFYINGDRQTHIGIKDIENYLVLKNMGKATILAKKFLTVSACGNPKLEFWNQLNELTGVACIIAPMGKVGFDDSAFFYTSFYFSLLRHPHVSKKRSTSERIIDYVDTFQKAKSAYLALGGYGAFRLCFWWDGVFKEII